jgi:antitoxin FitA
MDCWPLILGAITELRHMSSLRSHLLGSQCGTGPHRRRHLVDACCSGEASRCRGIVTRWVTECDQETWVAIGPAIGCYLPSLLIAFPGFETNDLKVRETRAEHGRRTDCQAQTARCPRSTEAEHREILRQALAGEDEPSFEKLAADLRKLTRGRKQTPSEVLLREGRDER